MDASGPLPDIKAIQTRLADWFRAHARDLPWRQSRDPWLIWLSEVLLQQTRVDQGLPYFEAFASAYPDVAALAHADINDVLLHWEGLGYYARARNLHAAAGVVVRERGGTLPSAYDDWLALPGVGPYTAAAVSSIAFGQPHAVLDGNVIRVLSRLTCLADDVNLPSVKRELQELATTLLDATAPGRHNEAMMELGATVCTPRNPDCRACPLAFACCAHREGTPGNYPVKRKKTRVPHHDIVVALLQDAAGRYFVQKRPVDAMLGGLWEFPGGKREAHESLEDALHREIHEELGVSVHVGAPLPPIKHAYSHFRITLHAFRCQLMPGTPEPTTRLESRWVSVQSLEDLAFPRANRRLIGMLD